MDNLAKTAGSVLPSPNVLLERVKFCESQTTLDKLGYTFTTCVLPNNNALVNLGLDFKAPCCMKGSADGGANTGCGNRRPSNCILCSGLVRPWNSDWHCASED